MASRLLDMAKQQRSRYTNTFVPLERKFVDQARVTDSQRGMAQTRNNVDVSRAAESDLNSRINSRLMRGKPSSGSVAGDLTDNAIGRGRVLSRAGVVATAQSDAEEDRNLGAATEIGQGLLSGSLSTARHGQRLDESEEGSKYKFNETRTGMMANTVGNIFGQVAGGANFKQYLSNLDFTAETDKAFPRSEGWR